MRIAIVNDMRMALEILKRIVRQNHEIAWTALDGREAVEKCCDDTPDLILMDLIMPVMDGVEATREIMERAPCAILVVTASVGANASKVYEAMSFGALDATNTPILNTAGNTEGRDSLLSKIDEIGMLLSKTPPPPPPAVTHRGARPDAKNQRLPLLAIGSSTGGPQALAAILSKLPAALPVAIVIIQHIDEHFAPGLADWLDTQAGVHVTLAQAGHPPKPGNAYIAATNDHLILSPDFRFQYTDEPRELAYRPSVDAFFHCLVGLAAENVTGILLTGMGSDGADGLLALRRAGHHTIAQDQESCIVYGMPRAAAERDAASEIIPLRRIADAIRLRYPLPPA